MDKDKPLSKRGGRREGVGRPKTDSQLFAFRANGTLAKYINSHENKTQFITECIEAVRSNDPTEQSQLGKIGTVYAATNVKPLTLPYFDISVVAGFPILVYNMG